MRDLLQVSHALYSLIRRHVLIGTLCTLAIFPTVHSYARGGQEAKVSITAKNVTIATVFAEIQKQTKLYIFYNNDVLDDKEKVSVQFSGMEVDKALKTILKGKHLDFNITENYIVIYSAKEKEKENTTYSYGAGGQQKLDNYADTIKAKKLGGRVLSEEDGTPVSSASVVVLHSKHGTSTNANGEFTLNVMPGDSILVSYIGKEPKKIVYHDQAFLNVKLVNAVNKDVAEVVVTGYQTVQKKLFAGSSATLAAKDLERAGLPDVTKMLEGQFAGVSLQTVSGTFGAAPKLRIRGATSLSGDNKPLWVIDGIIVEDVVNISNEALTTGDMNTLLGSSIAGVNPSDIQDITILRDAAATALYGARAMNGVVVVTTKKGKASPTGAPIVSYTGNFSRYIKPSYADFDIMNSSDQMGVLMEMVNKGYYQMPGVVSGSDGGIMYKMYDKIRSYDPVTGTYGLRNDDASKLKFLSRYANANTNWFDIIFKNSLIQEHSVSVASGTDKFQTYSSVSYLKDDGQTIGNNVERYTGNFRMNFKVGNKFRGELLTAGSVRNQQAPGTQDQQSEPVYGSYLRGFDINPYNFVLNTSRMLTPYDEHGNLEYYRKNYAPFNILNELNSNYMKLNMVDWKVQGTIGYKILPSLEYSIIGAYRYVKSENQTYVLENSNMVQAYKAASDATSVGNNQYLYKDPDFPNSLPFVVLPSGGFYKVDNNNLKSFYFRHSLEFNKTFGNDHTVSAFASMETRSADRQNEFFDGAGYQFANGGLVSPYYRYFKQAAEAGKPYFGMSPTKDRFLAYMGTFTYSYKNKYTVTPTLRYDGSNKMGKSPVARWLPTWNIAASWNITNESFWHPNRIVNSLVLRGSYGLTGNIGSATNSLATFYNMIARRPYITDQETLTYISALENAQLTWEKSKDLDIGTDIGFLNNRINFTVDYYNRKIHDLIGSLKTSGIGGQSDKVGNYGRMNAHGIEFTLNSKIIRSRNFDWTSRFNLAYNKNEIVNLETTPLIWTAVSGNGGAVLHYPQRAIFSVQFAGLDHYYGYPKFVGVGSSSDKPTTYINLQSDNLLSLKYEGPSDPTTTGGFYNQFRYKAFTFSALLKFSYGNVLRLNPTINAAYSDMQAMTKDMLNRWMMPGDETKTTIPAILDAVSAAQVVDNTGAQVSAVYPYNLYNYSTERVVSGEYIKLANISLAYQIPLRAAKVLGMTNAAVAVTANNIWTIKADKRLNGQDPEFYNSGGVALPASKQVTLSVKVGF